MNIPCIYHTKGPGTTPSILVTLQLNGQDLTMELDTGATLSNVSKKLTNLVFSSRSTSVETLYTTAENLHGRGHLNIGRNKCHCLLQGPKVRSGLLVVDGNGPSLLGHD